MRVTPPAARPDPASKREPIAKLDRQDKKIIKAVLRALILKAEAKRWAAA